MMRYKRGVANYFTLTLIVCILVISAGTAGATFPTMVTSDSHNTSHMSTGPGIQSAEGQIEVVVRLSEPNRLSVAQSNTPVETLRTQADSAHQPVIDYADRTRGVTVKDRFWIVNAVLLEVDADTVRLDEIRSISGVKQIHENFEIEITATRPVSPSNRTATMSTASVEPTVTDSYTYGLEQINVTGAWQQFGTKGSGVRVAVLDTGVDAANHTDLTPTAGGWKDFVSDRSEPYDDVGHGSHVSGTIVGGQSPTEMHYGVAPEAELLHGKVFGADGTGDFATLIEGFQWSIDNNADIISLSLGSEKNTHRLIDPVETANAAGVVVVASVGNDGVDTSSSPGNYYNTLNIGATTESRQVAYFSGGEEIITENVWGNEAPESWPDTYIVPTVSAPGASVLSTYNEGQYDKRSGTSMAAPHVAGTVALMQSASAEPLTPTQIETTLVETAWKPDGEPVDVDARYGSGIIDAFAATEAVADGIEPADIRTESMSVNSTTVIEGESVQTIVVVTNEGESTGTFLAELAIDGETTQTKSVEVKPNRERSLIFDSTFAESGIYTLSVNDSVVSEITVEPLIQSEFTFTPAQPTPGDNLTIIASVSSKKPNILGIAGGEHDFESIELVTTSANSDRFAWNLFSLAEREKRTTITWNATVPRETAGKKLGISTRMMIDGGSNELIRDSVEVIAVPSVIDYYSDTSGTVGDREVFAGVQDWQRDEGFFSMVSEEEGDTAIFQLVRMWQETRVN